MATYLIRRLLIAIPTLFGITILAFFALAIAPGRPAHRIHRPGPAVAHERGAEGSGAP